MRLANRRPAASDSAQREAQRERDAAQQALMEMMAATHSGMTTDATREFAYDRDSHIRRLTGGLNEAQTRGWNVVSMKDERKTIYRPATE